MRISKTENFKDYEDPQMRCCLSVAVVAAAAAAAAAAPAAAVAVAAIAAPVPAVVLLLLYCGCCWCYFGARNFQPSTDAETNRATDGQQDINQSNNYCLTFKYNTSIRRVMPSDISSDISSDVHIAHSASSTRNSIKPFITPISSMHRVSNLHHTSPIP